MTDHGNKGPIGAVMVVGGGVGGMRAAIDLAEVGLKVYLIESSASLGGRVAQLGFMFPTHDCVLCRGTSDHGYGCTRPVISPAFLDHNRHPNIEVMTDTEVLGVSGQAGDFTVILHHKPRYVDVARCINCGLCSEVCPVEMPSPFQMGLASQKAIYKPAPRSVPDAYLIQREACQAGCQRCVEICPTDAVHLDAQPWTDEIPVGAIILAVGYQLFDPRAAEEFGYGRYTNVVTSMEYERLASRSGPTEGFIVRPSDMQPPSRIAWLQCIGSRDQTHPYCSSICCMYATKEAMLAKQRIPGVDCQIFMMDERAFSKEYNSYFLQSRDKYHVKYTRCRVSAMREDPATHDLLIRYHAETGELREERFSMVVLSVGTEPPAQALKIARMLDIELNPYGFCQTDKFTPLETSQPGIYVCGAFTSPKEIAETIIDGSGTAGEVMRLFHDVLGSLPVSRANPFIAADGLGPERDITGEPPQIGVFVCECGPALSGIVDVHAIADYARTLPGVVHATTLPFGCLPEGQARIQTDIEKLHLNRVVVAGCSHRTHESLFQRVVRQAGLNPFLAEMVNIREQCAWVHAQEPQAATCKAMELVRMAVARVQTQVPVQKSSLRPVRRALVIGGGVSGMTAALAIADSGFDVVLVEREEALGGLLQHIYYVAEGANPQRLLRDLINRVRGHERIAVFTRTEVVEHKGHVGDFVSVLRRATGEEMAVHHGVTIVATGGREWRVSEYGLGNDPRVMTQSDLEELMTHRPEEMARLRQVVMIQCVRPGTPGDDGYCSRVCCTNTLKNAIRVKLLNPDCQVYILFKDILTYGFREQFYTEARRRGVIFIRYNEQHPPQLNPQSPISNTKSLGGDQVSGIGDSRLEMRVWEPVLQQELVLQPDLVALSVPVVPADGTRELASLLKLSLSSEGFFMEAHLKMRPMDFAEEGIFLCGIAHYPKFIEECISNALATAGRAISLLAQDSLYVGGVVAVVDQSKCTACLTCVRVCPFGIPVVEPDHVGTGGIRGAAFIDPARCQGCGTCTAECPATAIQLAGYRDEQLMLREVRGLGPFQVPIGQLGNQVVSESSFPRPQITDSPMAITAFGCIYCAYMSMDTAGILRWQYPSNLKYVRLPCTGKLDPRYVLEAFDQGADGVLVVACARGTCHHVRGNLRAEKRWARLRKLLDDIGLGSERLQMIFVSGSQGRTLAQEITVFTERLHKLGPNPLRASAVSGLADESSLITAG